MTDPDDEPTPPGPLFFATFEFPEGPDGEPLGVTTVIEGQMLVTPEESRAHFDRLAGRDGDDDGHDPTPT
jgi:hypothetical protein